jgi:hypothetical protein
MWIIYNSAKKKFESPKHKRDIAELLNKFWLAARLTCSSCEAMDGSRSLVSHVVSLAKVAMVDYGEVDRYAVYSRYRNDPMTLHWSTPNMTWRVLYTQFRPSRGTVCYANEVLG